MALCLFSLFKTILYVTGSVPLHYDEIFKIKVLDCVVSMALCFSPIFFFFLIFWFAAKTFWHILSLTQKAGWLTVCHHSTTVLLCSSPSQLLAACSVYTVSLYRAMVSLYYKMPFAKGQTELWKSVMPKYFHTNVSMCVSTADFDLLCLSPSMVRKRCPVLH